jgi:hypothetical protein
MSAKDLTIPQAKIYEKIVKFYIEEPAATHQDMIIVCLVIIKNLLQKKKVL